MNRRSALVFSAVSLLGLLPRWASATSLDPIFQQPKTIVLHLRIVTTDRDYYELVPREEMQNRLVDYVHSELARASLSIPVFDGNTYSQPDDMPSEFILWVDCRVDLATRQTEAGRPQAIGVVSVALRRDESNYVSGSHLSGEPFTFLETEKDEAPLVPNVEAAAKDAIKRSVLDYVIASNK